MRGDVRDPKGNGQIRTPPPEGALLLVEEQVLRRIRHGIEPIQHLSRKICSQVADTLTSYCRAKYCGISRNTMEQQMEDDLFVAVETGACLLGNAMASEKRSGLISGMKTLYNTSRMKAGLKRRKTANGAL